jgi:hypothetical protein
MAGEVKTGLKRVKTVYTGQPRRALKRSLKAASLCALYWGGKP